MRRVLVVVGVFFAFAAMKPSVTWAGDPGATTQQQTDQSKKQDRQKDFGDKCRPGIPGIDQVAEVACDVAKGAVDTVTGAPGKIAETVAGGVLDQATQWMTDAATWVSKRISAGIQKTATPELDAGWYRERFASMASLGIGLAALVAMMALASAALRRDPDALGATVYGMLRAGIGTGLVITLTVLALGVADEITNTMAGAAMGQHAGEFWNEVGDAWGKDNFAGFGSSAIAFLFALIQVIAGILVWIEMLLRSSAIYVAVLFLPAALAASIWPPLREWESRLVKALFVLIAMKPVIVTVLSLAGYAAAAAITGEARGDIGVLLSAIVIFVLAAWALVTLVSLSAEGVWSARAAHGGMREGLAQGTSRIGGSVGTARSVGSRMRGGPPTARRSGSGLSASGGGAGGRGGGGLDGGARKPRAPGPVGGAGGGGAASSPSASGGATAGGGASGGAAAAGPVGTVAAAAGLGAYATDVARQGEERLRTVSKDAAAGGGSRPPAAPAPRTGQRPGGGSPSRAPGRSERVA